ncbi:hypothetical protein [Nocardia brasiliensis]|uniref:hypothetical protein n=1 Tax=Nocardia brasiliensis TaxID=37326 RepID=UPI000314A06E|nr:hypothetical protein [Nocardia brasiliensis]
MTIAFRREFTLFTAVAHAAGRLRAKYRLTPEERRNLAEARAFRAAVFTASMGGHPYYR